MQQRTVFLIPSDDLGWDALRKALQERQNVRVIGEATSAPEATAAIAALRPDVVIAAAIIEDTSIRHLLAKLRQTCCPTTRFVVFAAQIDPDDILPFAEIGVAGLLPWSDLTHTTLSCCLRTVFESNMVIGSPAVVQMLIETQQRPMDTSSDGGTSLPEGQDAALCDQITPRQYEVLRFVAEGLTNREIGDRLCISEKTVKNHLDDIYERLAVHDRMTAARIAQRCLRSG
ncbi:MAG: response regulator transcription factor [Thermomicrobiales bacterium]